MCVPHFWINMKARGHLENLSVDGRTVLKCILKKWDGRVWTGLIWLRIGASDLLLWTHYQNFHFHKIQEIWLPVKLLASEEGPYGLELLLNVWDRHGPYNTERKEWKPEKVLKQIRWMVPVEVGVNKCQYCHVEDASCWTVIYITYSSSVLEWGHHVCL